MNYYYLKTIDDVLVVGEGAAGLLGRILGRIVLFLLALVVVVCRPLPQLFSPSEIGYTVYILPLLAAFSIKQALVAYQNRDLFVFNRVTDQITYNGYRNGQLTWVKALELRYVWLDNGEGKVYRAQLVLTQCNWGNSLLLEERFMLNRKQ